MPQKLHLSQKRASCVQGTPHIIPLLIKAGCSSSVSDSRGFTPVEVALVRHDVDSAYALYCAGALFTKRQLLLLSILLRHSSLLRCGCCAMLHCFWYTCCIVPASAARSEGSG